MASDRSTLQRGLPGANDPSAWQDATAPAGRRPPSTPRERKPALAALAVLLILGCALGTSYLVIQSGKRVAAVEISQQIGSGQRIPLGAMTEIQIAADTGLDYVPWAQVQQVSRFYAASSIPPGTLLTHAMVAASSTSTAGKDVMGLALKDGQLPRGLQIGEHVNIYQVSNATDQCPGRPGGTLAGNAIVLAINLPSATSGSAAQEDVEVALNPANAGAVACNAANGVVGIAVLPNGGRGAADPGTTGVGAGGVTPSPGTGGVTTSPGGGTTASPGTGGSGTPTGTGTGSVSPSSGTH